MTAVLSGHVSKHWTRLCRAWPDVCFRGGDRHKSRSGCRPELIDWHVVGR